MLAGNVVALLSPLIFVPILTFAFGSQNYDYESMKTIRRADDSELADKAGIDLEDVPGGRRESVIEMEAEQKQLARSAIIARSMTVVLTLALLILWPMPLVSPGNTYSLEVVYIC